MKKLLLYIPIFILLLASCKSIHVGSDYDTSIDFSKYKTFAFHKTSIDKVEISDLDKRRILNAIDITLTNKGLTKSSTPNLLVSINTKAHEKVHVNQVNYGWGLGWNPVFFGGPNMTYTDTVIEGILFIDLIDAQTKNLIWQGKGSGNLELETLAKEAKIKEFVTQILAQYPPNQK